MTQDIPLQSSGQVREGCRTGRSKGGLRVITVLIVFLGLTSSGCLVIMNDVPATTLSALLTSVLLAVDIADRLSILPVLRRI